MLYLELQRPALQKRQSAKVKEKTRASEHIVPLNTNLMHAIVKNAPPGFFEPGVLINEEECYRY